MKYLLIFALVMVGLWLWRSKRPDHSSSPNENQADKARGPAPDKEATEIVACGVCHVHLPRTEALIGPGGVYCSAAHRRQAGG
jgi:uncharacterized protein